MITITIDASELKRIADHMGKAPQWLPPTIDKEMIVLGGQVVPVMRRILDRRRYRGTLSDSVTADYSTTTKTLTVGPYAKRGNWDAGMIAQGGTTGGHNVPWKPIKEWGAFRGMTAKQSFYVLKKIRRDGVEAHPFLEDTVNDPQFGQSLEAAAQRTGMRIAALAVAGGKNVIGAETG